MLRHSESYAKPFGQKQHPPSIGGKSKREIYRAAAAVVVKDLRPYCFAEGEGMLEFIAAIFKAVQFVTVGDNVVTNELAPYARTVHENIHILGNEKRISFADGLQRVLNAGGGVSIDGVTLTVQEKHFYDFTLHYFSFDTNVFETSSPLLQNKTIILAEFSEGNIASDIRLLMNSELLSKFKIDLEILGQSFTLVTDWAAVMPNIVRASVCSNICLINEKWMGCVVHQLNTAMKTAMRLCETDPFLLRVNLDLSHVKSLVRIFKQAKWNHELGNGFHLLQEIETRFGTTHAVADRFVKSGNAAFAIEDLRNSESARKAKDAILKGTDPGGRFVCFPAVEAIVDAFDVVVYLQSRLEATKSPTIHSFLPLLQRCYDQLERIEVGGEVRRGYLRGEIRPSDYSTQLCGMVKNSIKEKIVVHDLWIAACLLHPYLRGLRCVEERQRVQYRSPGEGMIRRLYKTLGGGGGCRKTWLTTVMGTLISVVSQPQLHFVHLVPMYTLLGDIVNSI